MNGLKNFPADDVGKLLLRLAVGGLLLFHGIAKLRHGVGAIETMIAAQEMPKFLAYGVYVGEVLAPILILVGVLTRPAALVVSINMLVAIILVHANVIFKPDEKTGAWAIELPMFYLLGALAIMFVGAGNFSFSRSRGVWN
jgi:putative oxidoreductase